MAFLANPVIHQSLCQPKQLLRFRRLMDEGQTLIINLAKGRLGSDVANVLGGLIVSAIAHAAYSRQTLPTTQRRPFLLYIDEFHSFTTTALADMLSELRKHGMGLVVAHQFTSQLDEGVLEAIFGNVGTIISFRLGATDAVRLAKQFASAVPEPRDLVGLANYEVFMRELIDGRVSRAFSAQTIR